MQLLAVAIDNRACSIIYAVATCMKAAGCNFVITHTDTHTQLHHAYKYVLTFATQHWMQPLGIRPLGEWSRGG